MITLTSWNLVEAEERIIQECIKANPNQSLEQLAHLLNISSRTLYRKLRQYKQKGKKQEDINKAIALLEKEGFKIQK